MPGLLERRLRNARHRSGRWSAAARDAIGFAFGGHDRRIEIARRRFFEISGDITPAFAVDAHGVRYFVRSDDRGEVARSLYFGGGYERDLVRLVDERLVQELGSGRGLSGRAFVDVGANIGTATLAALHHQGAARALAVEPEPVNHRLLRLNLVANDLDARASSVQAAVTAGDAEVLLEVATRNRGDHRVRVGPAPEAGAFDEAQRDVIRVPGRRLESLVAEAGLDPAEIGVVWVDVQGHEGQVLAGAGTLLAERVPMLLEYWPYGLRRAAGLDMLHDLVASHYTRVIDLGRQPGRDGAAQMVGDLGSLATAYPEPRTFTNLLLLA